MMMERVATLMWLLLGFSFLLQGVQGRWIGSGKAELPPCSRVIGGIPGWDCYDLPANPLPPCDFKHQRIGFDCSGWPPTNKKSIDAPGVSDVKSKSSLGSSKAFGELPPCSEVWGGIPGWDCYDPPANPLPPCDFKHQRIGFDCSGWPPANKKSVDAPGVSDVKSKSSLGSSKAFGELPPCSEVWGGIPGWDCYDPPANPLPPCDFKHQRIGFDCSGWPATNKKSIDAPGVSDVKSKSSLGSSKAFGELPPCSEVWGGIPGWDCYDLPANPLPPCDFKHQRIGFDCSGWPPANKKSVDAPGVSDVKSKSSLGSSKAFGELPPCSEVWGGIPGWDCYDPPTNPLPPCDFKHQRIGFDCSGWPPASKKSIYAPRVSDVKSKSSLGSSKAFGELPPCSEVWGGIPGWDCYDPPTNPLPPCDFKHQRIGFDCSGWPPASKKSIYAPRVSDVKSKTQQIVGGHAVQDHAPIPRVFPGTTN